MGRTKMQTKSGLHQYSTQWLVNKRAQAIGHLLYLSACSLPVQIKSERKDAGDAQVDCGRFLVSPSGRDESC